VKDIFILGGPNGAGKTTAAQVLLPEALRTREFVNADEIARGLSPFNVEGVAIAAGRIMIDRMRALVSAGESFALETTCSGKQHAASEPSVSLVGVPRDGRGPGRPARESGRTRHSTRCDPAPLWGGDTEHGKALSPSGRQCFDFR
jgi:hypothetical protein